MSEPFGQRGRLLAIALLVAALLGLFVWHGTLPSDPATNNYPDEEEVAPDPGSYVGERVALGGTVVATDPVTIEVDYVDGSMTVVLANANGAVLNGDGPLAEGDRIVAFGTLESTTTLDAERAIVRAPWEMGYMYAVSFLGGLWVLGRFVRSWRFDRDRLAFVPRDRRLALEDLRRTRSNRRPRTDGAERGDPDSRGDR